MAKKREYCLCNCHEDWWDGEKHDNCHECLKAIVAAERQMTVMEIRGGLLSVNLDWKRNGLPDDIEKVLKDAEEVFDA